VGGGAINDSLHTLHIGLPGTIGTTVRMGDLNAKSHAFAAEIAFCHFADLLRQDSLIVLEVNIV
jgi:hypothetical protein